MSHYAAMKCIVNQPISNEIVYLLSEMQFRVLGWNPIELCRNRHVIEWCAQWSKAMQCRCVAQIACQRVKRLLESRVQD